MVERGFLNCDDPLLPVVFVMGNEPSHGKVIKFPIESSPARESHVPSRYVCDATGVNKRIVDAVLETSSRGWLPLNVDWDLDPVVADRLPDSSVCDGRRTIQRLFVSIHYPTQTSSDPKDHVGCPTSTGRE